MLFLTTMMRVNQLYLVDAWLWCTVTHGLPHLFNCFRAFRWTLKSLHPLGTWARRRSTSHTSATTWFVGGSAENLSAAPVSGLGRTRPGHPLRRIVKRRRIGALRLHQRCKLFGFRFDLCDIEQLILSIFITSTKSAEQYMKGSSLEVCTLVFSALEPMINSFILSFLWFPTSYHHRCPVPSRRHR